MSAARLRLPAILGAIVLVIVTFAALAPTPATAKTAAVPQTGLFMIDGEYDAEHDCLQLTGPDSTSIDGVLGGDTISLDTLIVLDVAGMVEVAEIDRAAEPDAYRAAYDALVADYAPLLEAANQSYDALDITMNIVGFDLLQPLNADGTPRQRTDNAQEIIDLAKSQYGGGRPEGTDIVYALSDLDIQLPGLGKAVAGLADCIGGVTYDDRAFAVGEVSDDLPFGPYTFYKDATAKIFAHEVGHLMGGHHHYQTCGDVVPGAFLGNGEVGPCSLMTNFVDFLTLPFGVTNSIVVRGHAEAYAVHNDG